MEMKSSKTSQRLTTLYIVPLRFEITNSTRQNGTIDGYTVVAIDETNFFESYKKAVWNT